MRSREGAIIVVFDHIGIKNAERVIAELEKQGLKKGDLVAEELPESHISIFRDAVSDGRVEKEINKIDSEIRELERQIKSAGLKAKPELEAKKAGLMYTRDKYEFTNVLFKYLLSKQAKIVSFVSPSELSGRLEDAIWFDEIAGKKVSRKRKRLYNFASLPIYEKSMTRRLLLMNPKFVLAGRSHLPVIKGAVAYKKAITLTPVPLTRRIISRLGDARIRTHYRAIKSWKKAKRRLGRKRKP